MVTGGGGNEVCVGNNETPGPPEPQALRKVRSMMMFNQRRNFMCYLSKYGVQRLAIGSWEQTPRLQNSHFTIQYLFIHRTFIFQQLLTTRRNICSWYHAQLSQHARDMA